jgi:DNA-binding MarR family transcriptional regulator
MAIHMCPLEDLTKRKRILLHLSAYTRFQQNAVYPIGMAQDGIAEQLGMRKGNVSVQLSRLAEDGCVESKVDHVDGMKTRRRVYYLTWRGLRIAESLKEEVRKGKGGLKEDADKEGGAALNEKIGPSIIIVDGLV